MLEVKVHNDGKEKYQSFEVWIDHIECEKGYGASQEQAIKDYIKNFRAYFGEIMQISGDLTTRRFKTIKVNWHGQEIK